MSLPHQPTNERRQMVETMSGCGLRQEEIAQILNISVDTLVKYYRLEIDNGAPKANAKVAANLFRQATKDHYKSIPAAIFWMKARAGWSEARREYEELPGKKEQAQRAAQVAAGGEDSEWGDDLLPDLLN